MGGHMSRRIPPPPPPLETARPAAVDLNGELQYKTELSWYKAACKVDTDLQSFDATLHARTNQVINALAGGGVQVQTLSFDSLKEVTECLLEMNQEVVKVILDCKQDIWKTRELFDLVEEYFENSLRTLDFCAALEKCVKRARDRQLLILVAIQQLEEEEERGPDRYAKTLEELKNFKAAGDPFTGEFFEIFHSVYQNQTAMLEKLRVREKKLDRKLRSIRAWRKVSGMIFAATFAAMLICSVVAAAMAAPPVAAALAAASSMPLGSMGKWFDSLWRSYEDAVKGQSEAISSMRVGTYVAINDLETIRVLIDRLEMEIGSVLQRVDFAIEEDEEEGVRFAVEEIKKKMGVLMKNVEDLGIQADVCSRDIRRARTVVLQRIIKNPNH